jgi:uncharacterized protein
MHVVVSSKRDALTEFCRRFHVRRLEVFGSAAHGVDFDVVRSDVDFLVEFDRDAASPFFGFAEALRQLLGRPIDLVVHGAIRNLLY